jgi:uncharacterized protein YggE
VRAIALLVACAGFALPASAQEPARPQPGTIEVVGHASAAVTPDEATVQVGVSTRAPSAAAALDQNSAAARTISDAAKAFGIAPADIRTTNVSLSPTYRMVREPGGGSQQQPDGYQAENAVEVRVRDLSKLGEFLRRTLEGGANRINGLAFGLSNPRSATEQVRREAVADAFRQANLLADAAGVKLGPVRRISFGTTPQPGPRPMVRMGAAAVPVEGGNLDLTADVEMIWAIEQP